MTITVGPRGYLRFNSNSPDPGYAEVPVPADARLRPGDLVRCIKTFISKYEPQTDMGITGRLYTVEAYLEGYDYVSLAESPGWNNAERFEKVTR